MNDRLYIFDTTYGTGGEEGSTDAPFVRNIKSVPLKRQQRSIGTLF